MDTLDMIRFLRQDLSDDSIRVISDTDDIYRIQNRSHSIYFWKFGYERFDIYEDINKLDQKLIIKLSNIVRIEKKIDSDYLPIWTKEEGLITQTDQFVRLNGRYYTIKFLEQLLTKIQEIKQFNF
jgi:hypothetical protein